MQQRKSIAHDYFYITALCVMAAILLFMSFGCYVYFSEKKQLNAKINDVSIGIEKTMSESFDYSNQLATFVGSQVAKKGAYNYEQIAEILSGSFVTNAIAKSLFSFTIFDWVTTDKKLVISGPYGILREAKDVSFRSYAKMAKIEPWKLHFDAPDYGIPSGQYILPSGMGITDKNGNFLGILSTGFNIANLNKIIINNIKDSQIKYIILSDDNKILWGQDQDEDFADFQLGNLLDKTENAGYLQKEITYKNIQYVYYKKFDSYPFTLVIGYDKTAANNNIYAATLPRIIELLSIGSIAIILLLFTRKRILTPLIQLSNIADQISRGSAAPVIPRFQSFEMNVLAKQLKNVVSYTNQLASINMSLENKVSERTEALEAALKAKTEFLNNISHEVRTPIQGFTNISEGLVRHWSEFNDQKRLNLATQVASNAKRLSMLIGNLLDLSKFTAGRMILNLSRTDLNELIHALIDECNTLYMDDKEITIQFTNTTTANILADPERMSQILRNLFVNALKFSPARGVISVTIVNVDIPREDGRATPGLHFAISDQGVGIPESELDSIFMPFTQSTRTKTKAGGTGLGLSICQEIIIAHHGKIWAMNNKGCGASFHFIIPISRDHDIPIKAAESKQNSIQQATILMIDDEETCLTSMELLLLGTKYKLIKTNSGPQALAYLEAHANEVSLILLDLMMPDMYGLNVLALLKETPIFAQIPVIIQSGASDQSEITKAYKMGVVGYIKKPYHKQTIINEINNHLEQ